MDCFNGALSLRLKVYRQSVFVEIVDVVYVKELILAYNFLCYSQEFVQPKICISNFRFHLTD